jgi:hypothetical protein
MTDHTGPHGDTQGPLGCRSRPVSAIQGATVAAPTLVQASANPCKTLQSASICFNLLQSALPENAIFCNGMLRNVSFCFAHTCASPGVPNSVPRSNPTIMRRRLSVQRQDMFVQRSPSQVRNERKLLLSWAPRATRPSTSQRTQIQSRCFPIQRSGMG